ncbi:hypothetical protein Bca4012_059999 [Brassica carinata]
MYLVYQIFGNGAVADLCVWKNKIKSGITFVIATIIWYILEIEETRLVPVLCSILLLLMLLLFIWVKFGHLLFITRPPTPEQIKERGSPFRALYIKIEGLHWMLYKIAYGGEDIKTSLWVIFYVAIIYTIGSYINLLTILYICLFCSMTIPVLYLQFQGPVDNFIWEVSEVKNKILEIFKSRAIKKKNVSTQTSTANGPSTSTANGPSTSTVNGLSTTANGPSTSTGNGPSTSTANGPSTPTDDGPSTSTANGPSTPTANEPSTPMDDGPCPHHHSEKELITLKREAKLKGGFYVDPEAKLFINAIDPKTKRRVAQSTTGGAG